MSIENCLTKAREYAEKYGLTAELSEKKLRRIAERIEREGGDGLTQAQIAARVQEIIVQEQTRLARGNQLNRARELIRSRAQQARTLDNANVFNKKQFRDNEYAAMKEAVRVEIEGGSLKGGFKTNESIVSKSAAIGNEAQAKLMRLLGDNAKLFLKGDLDNEIVKEIWALNNHTTLGQTGSAEALSIAKAVVAVQNLVLTIKQSVNAHLEPAQNWIARQVHDREKILADTSPDAKDKWIAQAWDTYAKNSFLDSTPKEKMAIFSKMYDDIKSGEYGGDASKADILRSQTRERHLIPESPEKFLAYNQKYGYSTLAEAINRSIQRDSSTLAKYDKWGASPKENFVSYLDGIEKTLKGDDRQRFIKDRPEFEARFRVATLGSQGAPAQGILAKLTQGSLTMQYLSKVGSAILSSQPDIAIAASLLRDINGKTVFQNSLEIASKYYSALRPFSDFRERMLDLGLFTQAMWQEHSRLVNAPVDKPGLWSQTIQRVGALNGLHRHDDAMAFAMATVLTKYLGDQSGTKYANLSTLWKNGLSRYGINEAMWDVMRTATEVHDHGEMGKVTHLVPEKIDTLSNDALELYMRKTEQFTGDKIGEKDLMLARHQLKMALGTMINDHAALAGARPDVRQRYFMFGDTNINSGMGQLRRLFWQFRASALVQHDVYRRAYFSGETPAGGMAAVASYAVAAGGLWALQHQIKQKLMGREFDDPTSLKFILEGVAGSGMGFIAGDVMSDAMRDRTDMHDILANLAGPTAGMAMDLGDIYLKNKDLKHPHPEKDAWRFAEKNVPPVSTLRSLYFTKPLYYHYLGTEMKGKHRK